MRRVLAAAAVLVAMVVGGCSPTSPPMVTPSHPVAASTPIGSLAPDPGKREAVHPDPNFDYGFVVQITDAGFHPHTLLSGCCQPVTWRNLTGHSVSVDFDHQLVRSTVIQPGGTWVFVPHNPQSITYHAGTGGPEMVGVLQVQQTFES